MAPSPKSQVLSPESCVKCIGNLILNSHITKYFENEMLTSNFGHSPSDVGL